MFEPGYTVASTGGDGRGRSYIELLARGKGVVTLARIGGLNSVVVDVKRFWCESILLNEVWQRRVNDLGAAVAVSF